MTRKKTKKERKQDIEDFGVVTYYCADCDYTFEVEWNLLMELQEYTHRYIGFHTNDVYISCPKCDTLKVTIQ